MNDDTRRDKKSPDPDPEARRVNPDFPLPGAERTGEESQTSNRHSYFRRGKSDGSPGGKRTLVEGSNDIKLDLGRWIVEGWKLIRDDLVGYVIASLIFCFLFLAAYKIHSIIWLAITGPLYAGFFLMTSNHIRTGRPLIGDLFQAFNKYIAVTIAMIVMTVFITAGFIACFIPGLFLCGIYFFTFLFIIDQGLDFWEAMEASRKVASQDYLEFALFALVLFVINLAGLLCFIIGIFITIPLCFAAVTCAYRELVGLSEEPAIRSAVRPSESPPDQPEPPHYPKIIS